MAGLKYSRVVTDGAGRRRLTHIGVAIFVLGGLLLPLASYLYLSLAPAYATASEKTNPRANYWRSVREGSLGYSAVSGQETDVLIQNGGQNWRQLRSGPLFTYGQWILAAMLVLLALFHLIVGKAKLVNGRSGQEVPRWSVFERTLHWYVAVLFIVLGLTGLSLLYGRAVIIPLMGKEAFAAYAAVARAAHNYLGPFFVLGLAVMIIIWLKENIPSKVDWDWFKQGGGYIGKSHPHAGRVNGGEKLWFWALVVVGIGVSVTGILLDFPNLGLVRSSMQLANLIHAGCGILLIAFALGHIYIGTLGNEGTLEGMVSGRVDAEWAKQHHDLWYEEVKHESSVEQAPPPSAVSSKTAT